MSDNLIELIGRSLADDTLHPLSSAIGADARTTQAALAGGIPAVLGAMVQKAGSAEGAGQLLDLLHRGGHDALLNNLGGVLSGGDATGNLMRTGAAVLPSLFGSRTDAVTNYVSGLSGLNRGSTQSLLGLLAPVVMGFVSRQLRNAGGFNLGNLTSLLSGQRGAIAEAAPPGLASALGVGDLAELGSGVAGTGADGPRISRRVAAAGPPSRWLLPLFALVAAFLLLRECGTRLPAPETAEPPASAPAAVPTPPAPASLELIERRLPDGIVIRIAPAGVESQLIAFIEEAGRPVDETTWFTMDRMDFETGSALLKPGSAAQLDNISAILKAWPAVKIKFGGYTDNAGDPAANLQLSGSRASNAMQEVVSRGISEDRVAAEGYGEQFPVADNGTEEGRQRNRRIDIRVTAK